MVSEVIRDYLQKVIRFNITLLQYGVVSLVLYKYILLACKHTNRLGYNSVPCTITLNTEVSVLFCLRQCQSVYTIQSLMPICKYSH